MFSNRNGPTHHSVDVSRERLSKIVSLARAHEADLLALDASDSYDDAGGGTFQVIEALRDRIDVVVKALHFNTRFLDELLTRIEEGVAPEDMVPPEIVFTQAELDRMEREVRAVHLPPAVILFAQVLMGAIVGALGVAVATPLAAAVMVTVGMLYVEDALGDKNATPSS